MTAPEMTREDGTVATLRDHHATIFLPASVAGPIEELRRTWDPEMARQIAAHVTLAYPQEAPDARELATRVRQAAGGARPFRLALAACGCFESPEDGVYVGVADLDGAFRRLRERLLRPPFTALDVQPHVTLVHPRTSSRGRACWDALAGADLPATFVVDAIGVTAFDGVRWVTVATLPLGVP